MIFEKEIAVQIMGSESKFHISVASDRKSRYDGTITEKGRRTQMIEAVVFDMDGVIFDSEKIYLKCLTAVGEKYGLPGFEDLCYATIGTTDLYMKEVFLNHYGEDFPFDQYMEEMFVLFRKEAEEGLPVKKGVREILAYLKENGIKVALATSTIQEKALPEIRKARLEEYFDEFVCGDMIVRGKPEPDIYLKACECLGGRPENACAIEDSFNGVRSASRAGMHVIMVPDLLQPDEEIRGLADEVLPSLMEAMAYIDERR